VRRALVSVYDKTGLEELGRGLAEAGVEVVSTGSTAARLRDAGVAVTAVDELTGFPECLDGRVKTLHPKVHAGILADLRLPDHVRQLEELGIAPFELVVVNLYPFEQTVASGARPTSASSRSTSAARRWSARRPRTTPRWPSSSSRRRTPTCSPPSRGRHDARAAHAPGRPGVRPHGGVRHAVASWFSSSYAPADEEHFPAFLGATWERTAVLRYGENPTRARPVRPPGPGDSLATAEQLHGKAMSYNNYVDTDAALRAAHDFAEPCVAIVKHANPCGIAVGTDVADAHAKAHACDPVSAFGGVIADNRPVSLAMAQQVAEVFTEVVVAPAYEDGAVELLSRSRRSACWSTAAPAARSSCGRSTAGCCCRPATCSRRPATTRRRGRWRPGRRPTRRCSRARLRLAGRARGEEQRVLLASAGATVGVGMGQVNRVDAARLACPGGERAAGSVAASDAFFPFPDGLQVLLDAGCAPSCSPAARCATRRSSPRRGPPARRCTSPAPATSPTSTGRGGLLARGARGPHLHRRALGGADFSEARLTAVVFEDCDLTGAELTSAVLDTCAFLGCRMERRGCSARCCAAASSPARPSCGRRCGR
jgi:phosphoribosylaminoimidazolecarboxamide formyltransferase/IMP cyclohydrolase